jgi:hypothetical protein
MPTAVNEVPERLDPHRKRWTREEYQALSSIGLFDQQKLELIEGELINKMGKKRPHVNSSALLLEWLITVFGSRVGSRKRPSMSQPETIPQTNPNRT